MFEISKKTDYGLELMTALAQGFGKGPVSLRVLAQEKGLPYRFLGQVVIPLKEASLVEAKEGNEGGYFLSCEPKKISLAEVIEALEGSFEINDCVGCQKGRICQQKNIWRKMEKILYEEMKKKTLADLI